MANSSLKSTETRDKLSTVMSRLCLHLESMKAGVNLLYFRECIIIDLLYLMVTYYINTYFLFNSIATSPTTMMVTTILRTPSTG